MARPKKANKHKDNLAGAQLTLDRPPQEPCTSPAGTLFLPIDSIRARVYLIHGLLYPYVYDRIGSTGSYHDRQSHTADAITFFTSPPANRDEQLVMHIHVTDDEWKECIVIDDIALYCKPLPICRVAQIDVPVDFDQLDTYLNGWINPDVPQNRTLFRAVGRATPKPPTEDTQRYPLPHLPKKDEGIEQAIATYNRYMGLAAFIRNADRYFFADSGCYADYPELVVSLFKRLSGSDVQNISMPDKQPGWRLLEYILGLSKPGTEWELELVQLFHTVGSYISKEQARIAANALWRQNGELPEIRDAFHAIFQDDNLAAALTHLQKLAPSNTAVTCATMLIMLYQYSRRDSNDRRGIKHAIPDINRIGKDVTCMVLAAMGAYYGYALLDAMEGNEYLPHPWITGFDSGIVREPMPIKFHLADRFERLLIETIYQATFNCSGLTEQHISLYTGYDSSKSHFTGEYKQAITDCSENVCGCRPRRYELNPLGRTLQRFMLLTGDTLDVSSTVVRRLLFDLIKDAPQVEYEYKNDYISIHSNRKGSGGKTAKSRKPVSVDDMNNTSTATVMLGFNTVAIKIARNELVERIASGSIVVHENELSLWIAEDEK